jgi:hypothetical protein
MAAELGGEVLMPNTAARPGGGAMLSLLAVATAIVCWTFGEDWRQEMTPLSQQLKTVSALAGRGSPQEIEALRKQSKEANSRRLAIESRLKADGDLEMVRAHLNADLRRFCLDALAKNCVVRLADDSLTNRTGPAAAATTPVTSSATGAGPGPAAAAAASAGLEALGVLRARGTVTGIFEADEPLRLLKLMQQDSQRTWRVNGVVVRGNSFEMDLERLVLAPNTGARP